MWNKLGFGSSKSVDLAPNLPPKRRSSLDSFSDKSVTRGRRSSLDQNQPEPRRSSLGQLPPAVPTIQSPMTVARYPGPPYGDLSNYPSAMGKSIDYYNHSELQLANLRHDLNEYSNTLKNLADVQLRLAITLSKLYPTCHPAQRLTADLDASASEFLELACKKEITQSICEPIEAFSARWISLQELVCVRALKQQRLAEARLQLEAFTEVYSILISSPDHYDNRYHSYGGRRRGGEGPTWRLGRACGRTQPNIYSSRRRTS